MEGMTSIHALIGMFWFPALIIVLIFIGWAMFKLVDWFVEGRE